MMIPASTNDVDHNALNQIVARFVSSLFTTLAVVGCLGLCRCARAEDPDPRFHWAFRPLQDCPVPVNQPAEGLQSSVDAFILEKLKATGLEPAKEADKRTLIRRAYFDLIGLPPTPAEVADFLQDTSPDAFAKQIDRLLASPHYGERWGRHWLDVARYANTHGDTGGDPASPYAFTYRDYVIRALNSDLPYDQFVIEQIAADRLGNPENSPTLTGLGFITVGRRFLGNIHDTIDDRIDVVTRGLMALTVNCARCHDHKYDPIPTKDYYGLYGVFASSNEPGQLPEIGSADPTAYADYQSQRQKAESSRSETIREQTIEALNRYRKRTASYLLESRKPRDPSKPDDDESDGSMRRVGARRWKKALEKLNAETDPVFAPWFAFAAIPEAEFKDRARELAEQIATQKLANPVNPIVAAAFVGEPPESLKSVAELYARLLEDAAKPDSPSEATQTTDPAREELRKALVIGDDAPGNLSEKSLREIFRPMAKKQIEKLDAELVHLDRHHRGAPLRAMVLYDNPQPNNSRIFIRGNANNQGEEAPRQFLEILSDQNRQPFSNGSGRLELARAIASRDNPLTARVLVNRAWLHHFGEGLVTTPDDFGTRSEPPSHPELLDHLATRFIEHGWSLKKLHRLMTLSHVYRQSSDDQLRSEAVDPANRLLSKMNRRRLDFESMRDNLLFVAGNLELTMGGPPEELSPQPRVALGGGFIDSSDQTPPTRRRAIYGLIDRQNIPGVLRAFDFADPDTCTGRRYVTTVPQQALFFFNNPLVMQQACSLVARSEVRYEENTERRIRELYQQIFQRDPNDAELELASRFVRAEESLSGSTEPPSASTSKASELSRSLNPWERLAHVLSMSDELVFVD